MMQSILSVILISCLFIIPGKSQTGWNNEQLKIIETIANFSETTAPNGEGADAYGQFLHQEFSRWTVGSEKMFDKESWIEGIREWFTDGWRVASRQSNNIEIDIRQNYAFVRRIVTETYRGPKNESSVSRAAVIEVWVKEQKKWVLYRANVQTLDL